jgi:hypothetical protein
MIHNDEQPLLQLNDLIETQFSEIDKIEYIKEHHVIKILLNHFDSVKCKKIFKRRFEEKPEYVYEYNGYVFEATPELKNKILAINLIFISCYDVDDKLCIIVGEKETGVFTKIIRSYKYHHLPCELKWKVTNITRYKYSRVMRYDLGEVIM